MKILYVVNSARFFLSHRLRLARAAQAAGFEVEICVPRAVDDPAIEGAGFPVHYYDLTRRSMRPWGELKAIVSLTRVYARQRPDLVHHITIKAVVYGTLAARRVRVPAVVNAITGLGSAFLRSGLAGEASRRAVLLALRRSLQHPNALTILQNPCDLESLVAAGAIQREAAVLIRGSGVDTTQFAPTPEPTGIPVVVLPSRMLEDKGVCDFVDAARILKHRGCRARFALCGDTDPGNPSAIPRAELVKWAATGLVEWWGHRADMRTVMAESNVVCLPSYTEGLPRTLIEAAASARVIVATDIPGCREVVRDGENGLLVPPGNPRRLAEALAKVVTNAALRADAGRRGREIAAPSFSVETVNTATLATYAMLLRHRGRLQQTGAPARGEGR